MDLKLLIDHYAAYDEWANTRVVERLSRVPEGVLDAPVKSSFPSLRATLMHIRDAEHVWLCRINGVQYNWPAEADSALGTLLKHNALLLDQVRTMDGEALERPCTYRELKGIAHVQPVWQMLLHCFNHASYHRGQVVTMMRQFDLDEIPALDLVVYQRSLKPA
jgi:uncharacterized damage-inducible protein DinB